MTALDAVSAYLPELRYTLEELAGPLAITDSQVRVLQRFHELSQVRRQKPGETLLDLLTGATTALTELRGREHLVRFVIYARGVPVTTPYPLNPVHELCRLHGLDHAVAFTVTHHACATSLLAVDIAGRLLSGEPAGSLALVVSGEQVFTTDTEIAPEGRVFGEGAGACLVSADGERDTVLSYVSRQRGDLDHWLAGDDEVTERFGREYPPTVAEVITTAVRRAGIELDDVRLMLPHNVNAASWRKMCRRIEFPPERVLLDNISQVGHTFAADAFINYRTAVERGLLAKGDPYLVVAAGFGATFSAMVLRH